MTSARLVSIVAPAHNAAGFLDSWIASIEGQRYAPMEAVLVDDGSSDHLAERAGRCPSWVRYIRQENQGPAAARNTGIRTARGDYLAFLDLDDVWAPGHLRRAVAALERDPQAGIAQGLIRNVVSDESGRVYYCSRAYRFLNLGAAVFRRSVFERCGLFDHRLRFAEDFDFITRCWEQGIRKLNLEDVSLLYHRHGGNMTNGRSTVDLGAIRVYKLHLDRVRAGVAPADSGARLQVGFPQYIGQTIQPHDQGLREPVVFGESR
jgi:glycosyltransferase involved in cell wall biosynthesis